MYSTHTLFVRLAQKLEVDMICDIGCLDVKDSVIFRKFFPNVTLVGFEANPSNFKKIEAAGIAAANNIRVIPNAVSDKIETLTFYKYKTPTENRDGIGSIYVRKDSEPIAEEKVQSIRIDDFILQNYPDKKRIAFWVDVEGAAYNVFKGMQKIADRVALIHSEVENVPVFENGGGLRSDIKALLTNYTEAGYVNHAENKIGDSVFLHNNYAASMKSYILFLKMKSSLGSLRSKLQRFFR